MIDAPMRETMMSASVTTTYDYVIVGGGVSGQCLAYFLAKELPAASILLIDRDTDPDYNISFWADADIPFQSILSHRWTQIAVRYGDDQRVCPLHNYRLHAFWRADFDSHLHHELTKLPNICFQEANVKSLTDCGDHVEIHTKLGLYKAAWAFDSRLNIAALRQHDPNLMLMQGLAWEIQTTTPSFDPTTATLFDFLVETPEFDFMYVLPYTSTYALVNCAFVTPYDTNIDKTTCEAVLRDYITDRLGIQHYTVAKACYGRIPLTSRPFARHDNSRIIPIGVRGGMVKASTSYAFTRILNDSQSIAHALATTGNPYYRDQRAWYYRWADKYTANIFSRLPKLAQKLMFSMFDPTTGDLSLRFLDERNSLRENQTLFQHIPRPVLTEFLLHLVFPRLR
jgi:lycopene beta-cyclase